MKVLSRGAKLRAKLGATWVQTALLIYLCKVAVWEYLSQSESSIYLDQISDII